MTTPIKSTDPAWAQRYLGQVTRELQRLKERRIWLYGYPGTEQELDDINSTQVALELYRDNLEMRIRVGVANGNG